MIVRQAKFFKKRQLSDGTYLFFGHIKGRRGKIITIEAKESDIKALQEMPSENINSQSDP